MSPTYDHMWDSLQYEQTVFNVSCQLQGDEEGNEKYIVVNTSTGPTYDHVIRSGSNQYKSSNCQYSCNSFKTSSSTNLSKEYGTIAAIVHDKTFLESSPSICIRRRP